MEEEKEKDIEKIKGLMGEIEKIEKEKNNIINQNKEIKKSWENEVKKLKQEKEEAVNLKLFAKMKEDLLVS